MKIKINKAKRVTRKASAKPRAGKRKTPLITRKQAIDEYGEELGPRIAALINSGPGPTNATDRLFEAVGTWAKKERTLVHLHVLPPGPPPGAWRSAVETMKAEVAAGHWSMIAVKPGVVADWGIPTLDDVPAPDASLDDICAFARKFNASAYWGSEDEASKISWRITLSLSKTSTGEAELDELLTALASIGVYVANISEPFVDTERQEHARWLVRAIRDKLATDTR